jgi:NADH-quinone oxidoreductase subunit G
MKVTIDGQSIEVEAGTTILQAARKIGGESVPPAMCYYTPLKGTGGYCRTCLVEVSKGSEADPRPMPKLVPSCRTNVMDGMEVKNSTSERVVNARNGIVEMLLVNHPLDCPICDQAGECDLQDLAFENGLQRTRTEEKRRTFEPIDIGDKIKLHMNRCILCYRCVKVGEQLTDCRTHGVINRGEHAEISTFIENTLESEFYGNVIDVCPVGALTDKTFRFTSRVWFTKPYHAHRDCPTCSGKVTLLMKGDEVLRVSARKDENREVTDFICNTCRFEKKDKNDWSIEGPAVFEENSVMNVNNTFVEGKSISYKGEDKTTFEGRKNLEFKINTLENEK